MSIVENFSLWRVFVGSCWVVFWKMVERVMAGIVESKKRSRLA